jgi:hypothetical protein
LAPPKKKKVVPLFSIIVRRQYGLRIVVIFHPNPRATHSTSPPHPRYLLLFFSPLFHSIPTAGGSGMGGDTAVGCLQLMSPPPGDRNDKRKVSFATVSKRGGGSTVKSKRRRRSSTAPQCGDFGYLPVEVSGAIIPSHSRHLSSFPRRVLPPFFFLRDEGKINTTTTTTTATTTTTTTGTGTTTTGNTTTTRK